jgi:signal transduction histidine kinase
MKGLKLSTKILLASGFILVVFCLVSVAILFQAQSLQATQEMDQLLKNETLALSALVNATKSGRFDFEISQLFLSQYKNRNPRGFFRFIDPNGDVVLKESSDAPLVGCNENEASKSITVSARTYRVETRRFRPEIDGELLGSQDYASPFICLIVGIDESPYKAMVIHTLVASVPVLVGIFMLLVGVMLILVRRLTRDLSNLTKSLTTADFSATHAFPVLASANTPEVKAVAEKLEDLHSQAANVYREMWLFLGRAAHQIKTPVTAMQATLDVLLRRERSKEELLAGLEDVKSAAALLAGLTKKLISSSRISYQETPPKEIVDLESFFSELISLFRSQADEYGVRVILGSTTSIKVSCNRSLMSDIFGNLIENAIIYSPKGKCANVTVQWSSHGGNALIEVSDEGPGFPKEVVAALFEPFMRGDERKIAGSGLGLSIAKKSAHLLGGEIELRASTSSGSKIVVTLPSSGL